MLLCVIRGRLFYNFFSQHKHIKNRMNAGEISLATFDNIVWSVKFHQSWVATATYELIRWACVWKQIQSMSYRLFLDSHKTTIFVMNWNKVQNNDIFYVRYADLFCTLTLILMEKRKPTDVVTDRCQPHDRCVPGSQVAWQIMPYNIYEFSKPSLLWRGFTSGCCGPFY